MVSIIKVNEIQNQSGTSSYTINSDGYLVRSNPCAFDVYLTSTQSNVTGTGAVTSRDYGWTERHNLGSHFSSGYFTAPVDGLYWFGGAWTLTGTSMGDANYHTFRINSTGSGRASYGLSMFDPRSMEWDQNKIKFGGSIILKLDSGDEVDMYGGNLDSGSNDTGLQGGDFWYTTEFQGYLLEAL